MRLSLWKEKATVLERIGIYELSFSATAEFVVATLLVIALVATTLA